MILDQPVRMFRWRQFSLRGLLVATTLCCAALGLWTVAVAPYRNQWLAVQAVIGANGTYRAEAANDAAWRRALVSTLLGEDRFIDVVDVDLQRAQVDDALVARLGDLRRLRSLTLDRAKVADEQLLFLVRLRELETLSLRFTAIGDEGVALIAEHPRLERLQLSGTRVTDASTTGLRSLPRLKELYLRWTDFSGGELVELADALPGCRIYHDGASAGVEAGR